MGKTVIDEMVARGLLMRLGFNGAGQWQEGKMIRTINDPVALTDDVKELDGEWKPIYKRVLDAHQNGGVEIRMGENGDATKVEIPKQDKKKKIEKKKVEKTDKETKVKATKEAKPKVTKEVKDKKMSALDAAAKVLEGAKEPMSCPEIIESMTKKGYWTSPSGKTPTATICKSIGTEIKSDKSRFKKVAKGRYSHT